MNEEVIELLKKANICTVIPGSVVIEAEIYNQALSLLKQQPEAGETTERDLTYWHDIAEQRQAIIDRQAAELAAKEAENEKLKEERRFLLVCIDGCKDYIEQADQALKGDAKDENN